MERAVFKGRLREVVHPFNLDDWEIDDHVERLSRYPDRTQEKVLEMAACLWPVSQALTFQFLGRVESGIEVMGESKLSIWVGAALDAYEDSGLDAARLVLVDGGRALLAYINGEVGLRFQDVSARLLPYLCGLAERTLDLKDAERAGTDTAVVYLPSRIKAFSDRGRNFLLYKYTTGFQWGHIRGGTYRAQLPPAHPLLGALEGRYRRSWPEEECWLESFFHLFPEPELARELYQVAETLRVSVLLQRELPGLVRDANPLLREVLMERPCDFSPGTRSRMLEFIRRQALGDSPVSLAEDLHGCLAPLRAARSSSNDSLAATARLYRRAESRETGGLRSEPLPFEGELRPAEAERARKVRREELRDQFVEALAVLFEKEDRESDSRDSRREKGDPGFSEIAVDQGVIAVPKTDGGTDGKDGRETRAIMIDGREIEIPEELAGLAREIVEDLGHLPESYVSGAFPVPGNARADLASPPGEEGRPVMEPVRYDEWDFRRSGFRKHWCALHELELDPVDYSFIPETLHRYRGQLGRIRRYFELMRTSERFLRRQREGEDIDIDAVTEALADLRAGRPSSDRLFVRLVRDVRDIGTLFLVDMSSSTEGWVNKAIKESLVLLCESLSIIGDQYAIYGFSGMKRLRSEFYHIKHFEEPYGAAVKGRIAAIEPRDYTRMATPIRHATTILKETERKVRLLVTLSDGRPEDYDNYRGEYSIEDTRHALIEAKTAGIHPFCITIDKEARSYIAHMYGEVNYIVIDDVGKLPVKMPEIYRALTT